MRTKGERDDRILLVLDRTEVSTWKSFRNLPRIQIVLPEELNPYDILVNDWLVFSQATLERATARFSSEANDPGTRRGSERSN